MATILTRAAVEGVLIRRAKALMALVGLDSTTQNGTNADLNDPIRLGLRALGLNTADPITVADADLATVSGWDVEKLLDVAELRLLESIWGNWDGYTIKASLSEQRLSDIADRLQKRIADLEDKIKSIHGPSIGGGSMGNIAHGRHIPADQRVVPFPVGGVAAGDGFGFEGGFPF